MTSASAFAPISVKRPLLWISGVLWIIAGLWYLLAETIAAAGFPRYSYAMNYISDLGVPGFGNLDGRELDSRLHTVMNAGFVGEGLFALLAAIVLSATLPRRKSLGLLAIVAVHAAGITIVGLVPGSPENAANGLMNFHGLGAVLAIGAGNFAAILAGAWITRGLLPSSVRIAAIAFGVVGFTGATLLANKIGLPDGVWERTAVYAIILWHLLLGTALLHKARAPEPFNLPMDAVE